MLGARTAVDQLSSSPGANPVQSLSLYMTMIGDGTEGPRPQISLIFPSPPVHTTQKIHRLEASSPALFLLGVWL